MTFIEPAGLAPDPSLSRFDLLTEVERSFLDLSIDIARVRYSDLLATGLTVEDAAAVSIREAANIAFQARSMFLDALSVLRTNDGTTSVPFDPPSDRQGPTGHDQHAEG